MKKKRKVRTEMLNFMIIDIFYLPQILFSNHGHHFIYNLYQAAVLRIMSNTDFNLILLRRLNGNQLTNEIYIEISDVQLSNEQLFSNTLKP